MDNNDNETFTFRTKLWKRGQNSRATTVPHNILNLKDVPVEQDVEIKWSIDMDGTVTVEFEEVNQQ